MVFNSTEALVMLVGVVACRFQQNALKPSGTLGDAPDDILSTQTIDAQIHISGVLVKVLMQRLLLICLTRLNLSFGIDI